MTYLDILRKETKEKIEDDSIINNLPYGWVYLKFDKNKKILRFNNYNEEQEEIEEYYREYPIRRDLYYKDLNRLIRYRMEDQERNYDTIFIDDIIEEFGDFDVEIQLDDNSNNEGNFSDNEYYSE